MGLYSSPIYNTSTVGLQDPRMDTNFANVAVIERRELQNLGVAGSFWGKKNRVVNFKLLT